MLDSTGEPKTMHWAHRVERFQNKQVQRSVRYIGLFGAHVDLQHDGPSCRLSTQKRSHRKAQPGRLLPNVATLAIMLTNSTGSIGFATCIWYPAESALTRSSMRARAVNATAGIWALRSFSSLRIRRISS